MFVWPFVCPSKFSEKVLYGLQSRYINSKKNRRVLYPFLIYAEPLTLGVKQLFIHKFVGQTKILYICDILLKGGALVKQQILQRFLQGCFYIYANKYFYYGAQLISNCAFLNRVVGAFLLFLLPLIFLPDCELKKHYFT